MPLLAFLSLVTTHLPLLSADEIGGNGQASVAIANGFVMHVALPMRLAGRVQALLPARTVARQEFAASDAVAELGL